MRLNTPADAEKQVESSGRTSDSSPTKSNNGGDRDDNLETGGVVHDEGRLILTEDEALDRARKYPKDKEPIYLCYSTTDRDNPRNWTKGKRWWVTCLVCWFNVLT